jgi:hypothetical protein
VGKKERDSISLLTAKWILWGMLINVVVLSVNIKAGKPSKGVRF